jgi:hypothetical protein
MGENGLMEKWSAGEMGRRTKTYHRTTRLPSWSVIIFGDTQPKNRQAHIGMQSLKVTLQCDGQE